MHDRNRPTGDSTHAEQNAGKEMNEENSTARTAAPLNESAAHNKDQLEQREKSSGSNTAIPLRGDETIGNP